MKIILAIVILLLFYLFAPMGETAFQKAVVAFVLVLMVLVVLFMVWSVLPL